MIDSMVFLGIVIFLAYIFDFINGFHDAANSIATIVTTNVLTPKQAVLWAAFFNFIAFLVFDLMVAKTIGNGLVDPSIVNAGLLFCALAAAIFWNLFTWYFGLPSSSSHALMGGLAGAAIAKAGFSSLIGMGFLKVVAGIVLAPILGLGLAWLLAMILKKWSLNFSNPRAYKITQLVSSALLSLTHGGNDAQKTMGIIAVLLFSSSLLGSEFYVPTWVVISCQTVIALGTLVGGWRIVHVMGNGLTQLNPERGAIAETSAASIIFLATELGVPLSTTHTVTGAIVGVGLKDKNSKRLPLLRRITSAWAMTIPITALISAGIMFLGHIKSAYLF